MFDEPSRRLPGELGIALPPDDFGLPLRDRMEVVRLHLADSQDVNPAEHVLLGNARAVLVSSHSGNHAVERVGELLEGPALLNSPSPKFRHIHPQNRFPKWLSHFVTMWQYANMESGRIGYLRRVANDAQAPNRIRELREAKGFTQAQLADLANVTPSALNKLEKGNRGLDQDWMRRLAPLLECEPADLLPDEDNRWRVTDEEREFLERYRAANLKERETFDKVADAILPYGQKGSEKAA